MSANPSRYRNPFQRPAAAVGVCWVLLASLFPVHAWSQATDAAFANAEARILSFVEHQVQSEHPGLRHDITLGHLDHHLNLQECRFSEAFARPSSHLWGRSFVGFHCLDGASWSVSVPVQVRVFGPALVPDTNVAAQGLLEAARFHLQDVELTAESGPVAMTATDVRQKLSLRNLEAGKPVPLSALHTVPVIAQGDSVKLVARGQGFSISTEGIAQGVAGEGESVRVRTENGKNLTGTAHQGRVVELVF